MPALRARAAHLAHDGAPVATTRQSGGRGCSKLDKSVPHVFPPSQHRALHVPSAPLLIRCAAWDAVAPFRRAVRASSRVQAKAKHERPRTRGRRRPERKKMRVPANPGYSAAAVSPCMLAKAPKQRGIPSIRAVVPHPEPRRRAQPLDKRRRQRDCTAIERWNAERPRLPAKGARSPPSALKCDTRIYVGTPVMLEGRAWACSSLTPLFGRSLASSAPGRLGGLPARSRSSACRFERRALFVSRRSEPAGGVIAGAAWRGTEATLCDTYRPRVARD